MDSTRARVEDIPEIAHAVKASALLMVPHHLSHRVVGFEAAPTYSRFAVAGTAYRSRTDREVTLLVGSDGVSLTGSQGSATVLFDECAAHLRWPDGARHLFGMDGINVRIEPTLFKMPSTALANVDHAVPPGVTIDMSDRDKDSIPKPARVKGIRARLRELVLPWRARLDHAAVTRGGTRAMIIAAALMVTTIVLVVLAFATGTPGYFGVAAIVGAILIWRRRNLRHW